MRALVLIALAACGSTAPPPMPPLIGRAEIEEPRATPAPKIGWKDSSFQADGLPAAARGGELAVVAIFDGDGGRGYPNLHVEVRDRNDKVVQQIGVMTSNEYEALAPGGTPGTALQQRMTAANRELAKLHGVHDLVAMHPLEPQVPADGGDPHFATGDGLDVDWNVSHLHVFHHNADHELATINGAAWLVSPHKPCPNCDVCENPAHLSGVYHATGVNLLVVDIGFKGTDLCWEPGDKSHVVTW